MKNSIIFLCLLFTFLFSNCYYDNEEELYQHVEQANCTVTSATFSADVAAIMTNHCMRCHRNGREDGGVNLEGYNNVKPYADNGQLYGTTNHDSGYSIMPTDGVKIPFCEIEKLRLWIEAGALDD